MALAVLCALSLSPVAAPTFNDGWYPLHGSAASLGEKHPTVRMESEVVKVTVHRTYCHVTTDFVFRNTGPATSVRMGFPDGGVNDDIGRGRTYKSGVITAFKSTVDGRPVKTTFVNFRKTIGDWEYVRWQVKTVPFKSRQTLRVKNVYRVDHGVSAAYAPLFLTYATYVLRTGATWRGTIGSAKVSFTFAEDAVKGRPEFLPGDNLTDWQKVHEFWKRHPRAVLYRRFGSVTVSGRTITFAKKDFTPETDLVLSFGPLFRQE